MACRLLVPPVHLADHSAREWRVWSCSCTVHPIQLAARSNVHAYLISSSSARAASVVSANKSYQPTQAGCPSYSCSVQAVHSTSTIDIGCDTVHPICWLTLNWDWYCQTTDTWLALLHPAAAQPHHAKRVGRQCSVHCHPAFESMKFESSSELKIEALNIRSSFTITTNKS